jgi:hypothetical protein
MKITVTLSPEFIKTIQEARSQRAKAIIAEDEIKRAKKYYDQWRRWYSQEPTEDNYKLFEYARDRYQKLLNP